MTRCYPMPHQLRTQLNTSGMYGEAPQTTPIQ